MCQYANGALVIRYNSGQLTHLTHWYLEHNGIAIAVWEFVVIAQPIGILAH